MSRKAILVLMGLYFLAAVAFSFFRVVTNPFLSGLNAAAVGNAVGGALLLYGGAGLLPVLARLGVIPLQNSVCDMADAIMGFYRNSTCVFY